jgi:hypothetical protein
VPGKHSLPGLYLRQKSKMPYFLASPSNLPYFCKKSQTYPSFATGNFWCGAATKPPHNNFCNFIGRHPTREYTAFCPDDPSFYCCCSDDPKICVCPNNPRKKRIGLVECDFHSRANGSTAQIPSYLATIHLTMYNALCNTPGLVPRSVSEATPPDLGALSLGQQF